MDITREQQEERYQKAPPVVQRLYDSEESGNYLFAVFQRYQLPEDKYKAYGITVGNVILGFYPFWQLSELLQKALSIPAEQATGVATGLQPFLAPIAGGTPLAPPSSQAILVQSPVITPAAMPANLPAQNLPAHNPPVQAPPPPAWQYTRPAVPVAPPASAPATAPTNLPVQNQPAQTPPPPIPTYQKPLTSVPQYRNANLYQKPPQ